MVSWQAIPATGRIPQAPFKTWSLFLVCNPDWLAPDKKWDLYVLYQKFQRFGRTIGDDHLAVWFWKSETTPSAPDLADNVDVERSISFCKAFGLKPSEGPHLLVLSSYPDFTRVPGDYADFALGAMAPAEISALLANVTDQLVMQGKVTVPSQESLWIKLLEATQQTIGRFGCAWTFKVQTAFLAADLRPCRQSG